LAFLKLTSFGDYLVVNGEVITLNTETGEIGTALYDERLAETDVGNLPIEQYKQLLEKNPEFVVGLNTVIPKEE
jgi:hypothetical protein